MTMAPRSPDVAMADSSTSLPDFESPPVDETFLSIQFQPVAIQVPHYGIYWQQSRDRYPNYQVQPPVPSVIESNTPRMTGHIGLEFMSVPDFRFWMLDRTGNRLIQIQKDRFIHNWRRVVGDEPYPRYPSLRGTMEDEWGRFCKFLDEEQIGQPQVNQCEVTYINHLEYDKGWKGYGNLNTVLRCWSGAGSNFLPETESVTVHARYRLRDKSGRLHISAEPVIRVRDGKEVLQLTLVARGAPKSSSHADVFAWLDMGREWVVRGFADFTTDQLQKMWGRK
jgi:uncharacterized protein (TIGR04255 family)